MLILGIETSCDETAASVVRDGNEVLSSCIYSQIDEHQKFGGVVPEIASRNHLIKIREIVQQSLQDANISFDEINGVAVTSGPGLVGALLVGVNFAKGLCMEKNIPLIPVNHLRGHIYSPFLNGKNIEFPGVCAVISGGHTFITRLKSLHEMEILGQSIDDSIGEVFDKVARYLDLGYPGGPVIDRIAKKGNPEAIAFPRPLSDRKDLDVSYSGLKTAVLYFIRKNPDYPIEDILASFQKAAFDTFTIKLFRCLKENPDCKNLILSGGVCANSYLRSSVQEYCEKKGIPCHLPDLRYCTDNAAMIAGYGYHLYSDYENKNFSSLNAVPGIGLGMEWPDA